ncbi:MAG: PfkB family carbohydrate kinase [Candidatus Andersenbacteria bacterium]
MTVVRPLPRRCAGRGQARWLPQAEQRPVPPRCSTGHPAEHWIIEDRGANDQLRWHDLRPYLERAPEPSCSRASRAPHTLVRRQPSRPGAPATNRATLESRYDAGSPRRGRGAVAPQKDLRAGAQPPRARGLVRCPRDRAALHRAVTSLLAAGVRVTVVTEGRRGATAYQRIGGKLRATFVGSLARKTVDTVGAGDAFFAGFTNVWLRTHDARRATTAGARAAAVAIAYPLCGATPNVAKLSDITDTLPPRPARQPLVNGRRCRRYRALHRNR